MTPVTPQPVFKTRLRRLAALGVCLMLGSLSLSCGYHLTSKGSNLPDHVKSIGVPTFVNTTTRPELGQRITENIINELIARGKYTVSTESRGSDAVLRGTILSWTSKPNKLADDDTTTESVTVTLTAKVTFEDRKLRRITWEQENYSFSTDHDIIGDPDDYFDTELDAVEEISEEFARAVVSAILQGF